MAGAESPRSISRFARVLAVALVFGLALVGFGAVRAEANVYCVAASNPDSIDPTCTAGQGKTTIADALQAAYDHAGMDTVRIGPGTFSEDNLLYFNTSGSDNGVHVIGSGKEGAPTGTTIARVTPMGNGVSVLGLSAGGGETVTASDLRVVIPANSDAYPDIGINAWNSSVARVSVVGPSASSAIGVNFDYGDASLIDSSIDLPHTNDVSNFGVRTLGNYSYDLSDLSIHADFGLDASAGTVNAKRLDIEASMRGATVGPGTTLRLDSSLIDLGTKPNGSGVAVDYSNPAAQSAIAYLRSVSIVGGGSNTRGIRVNAGDGDDFQVRADSVILNGQQIAAQAFSTASSVEASVRLGYSSYDPSTFYTGGAVGNVTEAIGNKPSSSATYPAFVNAAGGDYRLSGSSPLLDAGNPAFNGILFGPIMDLASNPRELHSDGACEPAAKADIGAYEYLPPSPTATIDSGPADGSVITDPADAAPTFTMTSSRTCYQTFGCSVDGSGLAPCSSPYSPGVLSEGAHTVEIRALGEASDPGPAVIRSFTVDTLPPETTVTGKSKFKAKGKTALASFTFGSNESGVTYTCKVVTSGYQPCAKAFKVRLRPGSYKLYVKARDTAGHEDATPAVKAFKVVK